LERLKDGEKFDFATLADNVEQTDEFWDWWWQEKADPAQISRPEIISPDEVILSETVEKQTVSLCSHRQLFDKILFEMTEKGVLPAVDGMTRESYHKLILNIAVSTRNSCVVRRPRSGAGISAPVKIGCSFRLFRGEKSVSVLSAFLLLNPLPLVNHPSLLSQRSPIKNRLLFPFIPW
jgi:hypothetical protein